MPIPEIDVDIPVIPRNGRKRAGCRQQNLSVLTPVDADISHVSVDIDLTASASSKGSP
jgi:hypothetical protein